MAVSHTRFDRPEKIDYGNVDIARLVYQPSLVLVLESRPIRTLSNRYVAAGEAKP